jgi:hypothetical protein
MHAHVRVRVRTRRPAYLRPYHNINIIIVYWCLWGPPAARWGDNNTSSTLQFKLRPSPTAAVYGAAPRSVATTFGGAHNRIETVLFPVAMPALRCADDTSYSAVVWVRPGGGRTLPHAVRLPPLVGAASAQGVRATARPLWSPSATCGGNGRCTSNPSVVGAWPGAGLALQNARNDIRLLAVDVVSAQLHATAWGLWGPPSARWGDNNTNQTAIGCVGQGGRPPASYVTAQLLAVALDTQTARVGRELWCSSTPRGRSCRHVSHSAVVCTWPRPAGTQLPYALPLLPRDACDASEQSHATAWSLWTPAVRNGSTFRYSAVVCVRPGGGRTLPYALRLPPLVGAASAQGVRATARPLWSPSATCGGNGRCTSNPSVVGAWPGAGLALQNARNDIWLLAVDVVSAQLHATAWGLWGRYRQQQDGAATRVAVQWRATGLGLWRVPLAGTVAGYV